MFGFVLFVFVFLGLIGLHFTYPENVLVAYLFGGFLRWLHTFQRSYCMIYWFLLKIKPLASRLFGYRLHRAVLTPRFRNRKPESGVVVSLAIRGTNQDHFGVSWLPTAVRN